MNNNEGIKLIIKDVIEEYSNSKEIQVMQDNINKMNKLLLGNGGVGICEKIRRIENSLKPLWSIVVILGTAILGGLVGLFFTLYR